jgi:hypothetical protein
MFPFPSSCSSSRHSCSTAPTASRTESSLRCAASRWKSHTAPSSSALSSSRRTGSIRAALALDEHVKRILPEKKAAAFLPRCRSVGLSRFSTPQHVDEESCAGSLAGCNSGCGVQWAGGMDQRSDSIQYLIFKAAADGALSRLIVFSVAFGIRVSRMSVDRREPLLRRFQALTRGLRLSHRKLFGDSACRRLLSFSGPGGGYRTRRG